MNLPFSAAIDFAVTSWIVTLIVLLYIFVRYIYRIYRERGSWWQLYWKTSAAIGMLVYDFGNFVLLTWFWFKIHTSGLFVVGTEIDSWLFFGGCLISFVGLFCKVRVFSDSLTETVSAITFIMVASLVSAAGLQLGWF